MPAYHIYRMKENVRQQFRWAPHTIGVTSVKPKDYELVNSVEAQGVYAVWMMLKESDAALQVGDILEVEGGELRIYKYVGFEEAQWIMPEVKSGLETVPLASGPPLAH
jgi:FAD synthase